MSRRPLTRVQRRILENVAAGRPPCSGRPWGNSAAGGWRIALSSCQLKGWLDGCEALTPAGREVLGA